MKTKFAPSPTLPSHSRHLVRHALAGAAVVLSLQLVSPRIHGQDNFAPAMNGPVYGMVPEPGGTVMLAGAFYDSPGNSLARYDSAGNNAPFLTRIITGPAQAVALLPDGTLLACGQMSALFDDGQPILNSFMRFSATGSLLPTFQILYYVPVYCLAPQADGKVLIGGSFTALDGVPRTMLARYLPTGALDSTFAPAANDLVFTIAVQPDGQILAGGMFTSLGGQARNRLGRLSAAGVLDPSFNPNANGSVVCLLVQPDGKILVGGGFTTLGGQSRIGLGRLNPDGSLDTSFNLNANASVQTLTLQANGKILVGGEFTALGGQSRSRLARLNSDGTLDATFTAGANNVVYSLALQEDGMVLVGGDFTVLGGQSRTRAGRLANPDAPTQNVTLDGATLTWQRGGSLTEVWRTEAEAWTGTGWTNLGPGTRIAGGWQWTGLSFPTDQRLRLRGHAKGGRFCASTWLPETYAGPLELTQSPTSRTNLAATSVSFSGGFLGGEPITYRWHKDGASLVDNANISGTATPTLTLASVLGGDAGAYALLASNAFGTLTSMVATLSVIDPVITAQPAGMTPSEGSDVALTVTAVGTGPLGYQWHKDGAPFPDATNSVLAFTNVQRADSGDYWAVVSNVFASVTSSPARLSVSEPPTIVVQPSSQSNYLGSAVILTVTSAGSHPLTYQWRKNGQSLSSATGTALNLPNLAHADVANYDVVVANAFGSVTSAPTAVVILNPYLLSQPGSLSRYAGENAVFSVSAGGLAPLWYVWRKAAAPIAGATASTLTLTGIQATDAGNFDVVVTNLYGAVTSAVAVLSVTLVTPDDFNPNPDGPINTLLPLPGGKVLAGGLFQRLGDTHCPRLGRLNADSSLDLTFASPAPNGAVNCLAIQPDGKILVAGDFTSLAGQTVNHLARLHPDGSLDATYNPNVNGSVFSLALQPDGAVVLGGSFSAVGGQTRTNLARLLADGTLDTNFTAGANNTVYSLALQSDGSILVGGSFIRLAGMARNQLGRLSSAGVPDALFNPGANGNIYALAVRPDGKILVGGTFVQLAGRSCSYLGQLNSAGSLDTNFVASANQRVQTLTLQADGGLLVGGQFTFLAGQARSYLGRLTAAGTLDVSFAPTPSGEVRSIAPLADGRLYVGGIFSTIAGQARKFVARLQNSGPAEQDSTFDGGTLTWFRSGTVPEVSQAFAEAWTGQSWTNAGLGVRTGVGWQWSSLQIPPSTTFRLQGRAHGGNNNGSSWWISGYAGFPQVLSLPSSLRRSAGGAATLSVQVIGSTPFSYRWFRNGALLANDSRVSGATTSNLVLTALGCGDTGDYSVIVSNYSGSVTSLVASLAVQDPAISTQPRSSSVGWGSNLVLTVTATGTPPFAYQWRKAGIAIPGATGSDLSLSNMQPADAVSYDVVVTGSCGYVQSILAHANDELVSADGVVLGLAPLMGGRILAAGAFTTMGAAPRLGMAQSSLDGSLDRSFQAGSDAIGYSLAVQPNGDVIAGGYFTSAGGLPRRRLARWRPDGSLDPSFDPDANGAVLCLALQADGKILAGGSFSQVGGLSRSRIVRLNLDGTVDTSFSASVGSDVYSIAVQTNGLIVVGGPFSTVNGIVQKCLARVTAEGMIDPSFTPALDSKVHAIALQPDGKLLIGGSFTKVGGFNRAQLARLDSNGVVDPSFNPGTSLAAQPFGSPAVNSIVMQADGRILVGGAFTSLGGQPRSYLGRLNQDGSVDDAFNPTADFVVNALALQSDGRVLAGGYFATLGGIVRRNIGRLDNTDLAMSSLTVGGGTATWLRGGTGPEVWRTTFDLWTGTGWTNLGAGSRINGGWQVDGLSLPANATVRAQGFAISGDDNCSSYIVEEGFGPPVVSIAPVSRTNFVGTTASLNAWVVGSGPVSYRWRKGGVALADGGNLSGTGTPNLSLANVQTSDSGWYSVVATNALGSVTSTDVYLAVVPLQLTASGPGLGWATNRQFSFQLNSGGAAWPVNVDASTNLLNWQGLSTLWLGPAPGVFSDAAATNFPARFYRAQPVP